MGRGERAGGARSGRGRSQLVRPPPPSFAYRPPWLSDCGGKRITVVGADGFIGSHVVALALAAGADVRAVCLKDPWRLAELDVEPEVEPRWSQLGGNDADAVAVLAYEPPPSYERDRWLAHELEVNADGACELARSSARTVFASSADVYGPWRDEPVREDVDPQPATPYAQAKLRAEARIAAEGHEAALLRLATVFGPSEHSRRAIPAFITAVGCGEQPVVHGDGSDVRDYVYVGDVAAAFVNACSSSVTGVFNLGSGIGRSTLDVLQSVCGIFEADVEPRLEPTPRAPSRLIVDPSRARRELQFSPRTDFERALREEADWLLPTPTPGRKPP